MDTTVLFTAGIQLLVVLLAVSAHEAGHATAADLCGDPTGRTLGRVTLNPLRHFDAIGSFLLPAFLIALGTPVFGWARPVPVLGKNLRRPGRDEILIAAAGPAANFLLALVATVGLGLAVRALGPEAREAAQFALIRRYEAAAGHDGFPLVFTLLQVASINAFIGLFNLMPLPPLDGARIVWHLLPPAATARLAALRSSRLMIMFGVAVIGAIGLLVLLIPVYVVLSLVIRP